MLGSTNSSVSAGTPSILAIIETLAAVSIMIWLAEALNDLRVIAVAAIVAPFLLLRTDRSQELGLRLLVAYAQFSDRIDKWDNSIGWSLKKPASIISTVVTNWLLVPFAGLVCKVAATLTTLCGHPVLTVTAIPRNWWRIAACVDLRRPPELVPGFESTPDETALALYKFSNHVWFIKEMRTLRLARYAGWSRWFAMPLFAAMFGLFFFAPSIWYRWSLKATAIVYLPLTWAVVAGSSSGRSPDERLEDVLQDKLEGLRRGYSYVAVAITIVPFLTSLSVANIAKSTDNQVFSHLLQYWVPDGSIRMWHAARLINGVLTIGLFVFADRAWRRSKRMRPLSSDVVHLVVGITFSIRALLGIYLAVKLAHLIVTSVEWDAMEWRLVLW